MGRHGKLQQIAVGAPDRPEQNSIHLGSKSDGDRRGHFTNNLVVTGLAVDSLGWNYNQIAFSFRQAAKERWMMMAEVEPAKAKEDIVQSVALPARIVSDMSPPSFALYEWN